MSFSSFVRSSKLDGIERVTVEGISPLDRFDSLQEQITTLAGPSLGKLFCEPLISEGNGAASTTVSWYAAYEGEAVALTSLGQGERAAAEALLRARIEALQPVIAKATDGQLIAAALYLLTLSDVFVIDGEPVLTNWGILPQGNQTSATKRNAAFATGLGALGLALSAPPLAASEFSDWRERLPGAADPVTADVEQTPSAPGTDELAAPAALSATAVVAADNLPWYRRAWAPALLATVVAALVLIVLLIPGVLLAPPATAAARNTDQARLLEDSNRALEERLDQLRNARETGVCTADGTFDAAAPPARQGLVDESAPTTGDGTEPQLSPVEQSLLPPPLDSLTVPGDPAGEGDATSLLDIVDASTVLVIASGDTQVGIGSGFFVAPGLVVTNDHVIADGVGGQLYVTSESLGQVVPVELVARTGASPDSKVDFALLRGDFGDQPILAISDQLTLLSHVVAAGFPLVVASEDARFRRLLEQNDPTAVPSTSTTRGVVTSIQSQTDGTEVIAHDAEINQGNSGGPLLDLCGRVVGVNTYLLRNAQTGAVARFALHSRELRRFLEANSVAATFTSETCRPVATAPQQAPAVPAAVDTQAPSAPPADPATAAPPAPAAQTEPATETEEPPTSIEPDPAADTDAEPTDDTAEPAPAPALEDEASSPAPIAPEMSVAPPPERRVRSPEAGLPDGVIGDTGLVSE